MARMSGNDNSTVRKDMRESPSSEAEVQELQENAEESEALGDPGIDEDRVVVLPGTGGPDDVGDIEPDPQDEFSGQ